MISKKNINPFMLIVVAAGFTPLLIAFFSVVSGIDLLPRRWWYFAQVLLAVPVAVAFLLLSSAVNRKQMKPFFLVCGVFFLCFFLITNPTANIDNPSFSPNTTIRFALKESEIRGAAFCVEYNTLRLSSDYDFFTSRSSSILLNYFDYDISKILSLDEFLLTGRFDLENTVIVIRDELVDKTFRLYGQPFQLDYDPHRSLEAQGFSQIYDNSLVSCYL